MDAGLVGSIVLGLGVAGHAVVGSVLTTRLRARTENLWSRFGDHSTLLHLNGVLLVVASLLHLVLSAVKAWDAGGVVLASSVLPFPFFAAAGILERADRTAWPHHVLMLAGWLSFAWHGSVAAA